MADTLALHFPGDEGINQRYGTMYYDSLRSVPPQVFRQGYSREIRTPSSHVLLSAVTRASVEIWDPTETIPADYRAGDILDSVYRFSAQVNGPPDASEVSFYIRNRNPLSATPYARHPDIHPTALAARSLDFFQSFGRRITTMSTLWVAETHGLPVAADNWTAYHANLARETMRHSPPTDRPRQRAASATWSGQLALRLGFMYVGIPEELEGGRKIACRFTTEPNDTVGT